MENTYQNPLRTHYSPIKRKRNTLTHYKSCKSYLNNDTYNLKKKLNINTNHLYTEIIPVKNKTSYKTLFNEYTNYPNCNYNYHYKNNNINLKISEKEKLNKSFNRVNPYYFQDKVQLLEKDKINEKVKNRIYLQREAIKQLSLNKLKYPSEKEKLQKINEFSQNPMISYDSKPPFQVKTLNNYYFNEYLTKKNNNINLYIKPRKEIEDYYNKCQYQTPINFDNGNIIHTKPNYIFPNYEKNKKNGQKMREELDKQIENKINKKRKKNNEDEKNRRYMDAIYGEYEIFLKKKEREEKLNKEKEIIIDNNLLKNYKIYEKNNLHDGEKEYMNKIKKKMDEEDFQKKLEEKQEKLKTMKNLREWSEINKKIKENKNKEKNREKIIWRNYSEIYIIKCKHGNELYRCCRCGKKYSRDKVHKVIY